MSSPPLQPRQPRLPPPCHPRSWLRWGRPSRRALWSSSSPPSVSPSTAKACAGQRPRASRLRCGARAGPPLCPRTRRRTAPRSRCPLSSAPSASPRRSELGICRSPLRWTVAACPRACPRPRPPTEGARPPGPSWSCPRTTTEEAAPVRPTPARGARPRVPWRTNERLSSRRSWMRRPGPSVSGWGPSACAVHPTSRSLLRGTRAPPPAPGLQPRASAAPPSRAMLSSARRPRPPAPPQAALLPNGGHRREEAAARTWRQLPPQRDTPPAAAAPSCSSAARSTSPSPSAYPSAPPACTSV
mmetsp:Transcript_47163/g.153279  ORF Transcript_47163/g.153279 Transcript_47163/m.153279 type:complete len:300 (+) Transcript_47163:117-1016(+)